MNVKVANLTKVRESTAATSEDQLIKNLENELNEENQIIDTSEFPIEDYSEEEYPEDTNTENDTVAEEEDSDKE
jgi:hypothetical protein